MSKKRKLGNSQFTYNEKVKLPRSLFKRTFQHKTTINGGLLIPFMVDEVLPGDTFNIKHSVFARLSTPLHPMMDNAKIETFYFFVPNRLLWDSWETFKTGKDETKIIPKVKPELVKDKTETIGSINDYFGIPSALIKSDTGLKKINALPYRAYNLIFEKWFKPEFIDEKDYTPKTDDEEKSSNEFGINGEPFRVTKKRDYFTTALPTPQAGTMPQVPISSLNLVGNGKNINLQRNDNAQGILFGGQANESTRSGLTVGFTAGENDAIGFAKGLPVGIDTTGGGFTINDFRTAMQIQSILEKDMRFGQRYIEHVYAHYGVVSDDGRLQNPEFITGSTFSVDINQVPQTSETADTPQGNLAAFGISGGRGKKGIFTATEDGYLIGLMTVRADVNYQ